MLVKIEIIDPDKALRSINQAAEIIGDKPINIRKAINKALKPQSREIFNALKEHGPSTYKQLHNYINLSDSELNHALQELKRDDPLLIQIGNAYYPTQFGDHIFNKLKDLFIGLGVLATKRKIFEELKAENENLE